MGEKKYTFMVHPEANKSQIKEAVEKNVRRNKKQQKVNTMNNDGKTKRTWNDFLEKLQRQRKAIVQLTEESADIEIFEGLQELITQFD